MGVVGVDALLPHPTPTPTTAKEPSGTPLWGECNWRHTGRTPRDPWRQPYLSQRPRQDDRQEAGRAGRSGEGRADELGRQGCGEPGTHRRGAGSPGGTVGSRAGGLGERAPPGPRSPGHTHLGPAHLAELTWLRPPGPAHGAAVTAPGRCPAAERVPAGQGRPLPPPEGRAAGARSAPPEGGPPQPRPSAANRTVRTREFGGAAAAPGPRPSPRLVVKTPGAARGRSASVGPSADARKATSARRSQPDSRTA